MNKATRCLVFMLNLISHNCTDFSLVANNLGYRNFEEMLSDPTFIEEMFQQVFQ